MQATIGAHRAAALSIGRRLERLTIVWAGAEAALGLWSAWQAHSLSLAAFGLDSLIEIASATALLWRLRMESDAERRESAERISLRTAAVCLLLLAAYVLLDALRHLFAGGAQEQHAPTVLGIIVTASAVLLMPLLGRAKRRIAERLHSPAMAADARQADFCALQALIVLLGLFAAHLWHVTRADSIAALLLVPLIVREGVRALQGKSCGCAGSCA